MDGMIGRVLGNRYQIMEKIGEGGMAHVYKAKCLLLNRFVAVKVLRTDLASNEDFVGKFEQESQAAASLSNPNIVNIYDVGNDGDTRYIVMELIKGLTLKKYIQSHKGFIPNEEIIEIAKQIGLGLEHAHANRIVHRDIKPHNIMINEDGIVKVADFGIARAATTSTIVSAREALGSVHYASPEQSRGGFVDKKSDIYSLGILLYELATKKLPFDGEQPVSVAMKHMKEKVVLPSSINGNIKKALESIILKAIQKDPTDRYSSVRAFIDDLDKLSKNPHLDVPFYVRTGPPTDSKMIPNTEARKEGRRKGKDKTSRMGMALVIFAGLVVALVVVGGILAQSVLGRMRPQIVKMPDIEGMEYTAATEALRQAKLNINVKDHLFDPNIKKDHIIKQFKDPGVDLKEGFTVDVVVSNGPEIVKIPNLIQKDLSEAQLILENKSLVVGEIKYEYSDLPNGMVVKQSPLAGVDSQKGAAVELVVSQGQPIETVIMPNVLGKTLSEAQKSLKKANLVLGSVDYNESKDYFKDTVMIQSVKAGKEVKEKTTVNIVISKGGEVENPTEEQPNVEQPENGEKLVEKTYIIPLNFTNQKETVRVEMIQNEKTTVVYEKEHDRSEKDVRVVVKGQGMATINIYFGAVQIKSMPVNFN